MAGVGRKTLYIVLARRVGTFDWLPLETYELFTAARYYVEKLDASAKDGWEYAIDKHEITTKVNRAWTMKG